MSWNTERGQRPLTPASARAILAQRTLIQGMGGEYQDPRLTRAQEIIDPVGAKAATYARKSAITSIPPEKPSEQPSLGIRDLTPPLTESLTATEFCGPRNGKSGCEYFIAPEQCDIYNPLNHCQILRQENCFSAKVDGEYGDMTREGFQPEIPNEFYLH